MTAGNEFSHFTLRSQDPEYSGVSLLQSFPSDDPVRQKCAAEGSRWTPHLAGDRGLEGTPLSASER